MNWGNKLLATFVVFAILMSGLVYKCTKTTFDLVSKDYYADELRYQDKIDGMQNASTISPLTIDQNKSNVRIKLPGEMQGLSVTGEAWFYCATDASLDKKFPLSINGDGLQFVDKNTIAKTNYLVKVNWKAGNKLYYSEKKITVE